MGDERDLAVAGVDGSHRMGHVNNERRPANRRAVSVARADAHVLPGGQGAHPGGEEAIHVARGQAGVGQGVIGRLSVVLERRLVGHDADLIGLGYADDRGCPC